LCKKKVICNFIHNFNSNPDLILARKAALARVALGMGLTSRSEGSAWGMLSESVSQARREYELFAFIENPDTDTQAYVYRSVDTNSIWVAFRGTEQTKWKDIVTDMMITPREPEFAKAPTLGDMKITSLSGRRLSENSGEYYLQAESSRKYTRDNKDAHTIISRTEAKSGSSPSWNTDLTLENVRKGDTITVRLMKENEELGEISLVAGDERLNEERWYPIGGLNDQQVKAKVEFVNVENNSTDSTSGVELEKMNGEQQSKPPQVHEGFLTAFKSIRKRVIATVYDTMMVAPEKKWKVHITGHSLGGALATLCSYELAAKGVGETEGPEIVPEFDLTKYSFGSPRVGNAAFARDFDKLVPNSWRLYNSKDVIATVPRLLSYSHVRTGVMIDSSKNAILLGAASRQDQQCVGDECDYVEAVTQKFQTKLNMNEMLSSLTKVVDTEMERLSMLTDGSAIADHMEDLYFFALQRIILKQMLEDEDDKKMEEGLV